MSPKNNIIPPDIHFQKSCGISINKVLTLSKKVKIIIDPPRESIMVNNLFLLTVGSDIEWPIITGKSGSMHGASTVRTPAINEINKNNITLVYKITNPM